MIFPSISDDSQKMPTSPTEELLAFLCRPIVFEEPDRVVHPPSWLEHIPFAFWIIDALRPGIFVELGTQSGNSYAAFAQAISALALTTQAYAVDTWKGDDHTGFYDESVFEDWRAYHDAHFSSFSRLVRSTFGEAAPHFADGSIDLLHLDGCHTYEAAAADFELWRPKMSARGVMLLHDTNVRERDFGVWKLWEELSAGRLSFEFLHGHGLGVMAIGSEIAPPLRSLLSAMQPEQTITVRRFFAQRGRAITARYATEEAQREITRQRRDRDRLNAELTEAGARLAALIQKDQERAALEQQLRAQLDVGQQQLAGAVARADDLDRRLQATTLERDQLATSMYRRVRTRLVRGLKRIEAGARRS
jgi:hypothetical protein